MSEIPEDIMEKAKAIGADIPYPINPWPFIEMIARAVMDERYRTCQCDACRPTIHASDCAVHNMPASPNGPCDCGAAPQVKKDS